MEDRPSPFGRGMTDQSVERRRDAHHILLDLDAIGESIIPEAKSVEFIKKHSEALREILRQKAGL